ncbi:hypothetical protein HYH02_000950 [Chlamydomonas schloesseri]|uniref:Uncharacterized protein n=1 Tax=Chlamydomonas schloesseri TaxID=2026947 RepID=A0A835WYZ7_9CHLO|nr:hypothetical protein HYH02_000950 [Chlamydomonas schloesseri]|eukprot:KAG2455131.1 hypothetical protein HYH02_000950 [Chlamydomonas schloesseri]
MSQRPRTERRGDEGPESTSGAGVLTRIDWGWDLLAVSIVYLVEGVLDMGALAVSYYAKDNLSLGPASAGLFQTAGQLPWELTPLLGLLTDLVPLAGYRRKSYLLLVGLVGAACWAGLAALQLGAMAAGLLLVGSAAATAWTQVIADAVLVGMSQGKSQDVASFYQGLSWATYTGGAVLSAYTTGRLLDAAGPRPVFALAAVGLLLDGACALLLREQRVVAAAAAAAPVAAPPRRARRGEAAREGRRSGGWWEAWMARWGWARKVEEGRHGKRRGGGGRPEVLVLATVGVRQPQAGEEEDEAEPLLLPRLEAEVEAEERSPRLLSGSTCKGVFAHGGSRSEPVAAIEAAEAPAAAAAAAAAPAGGGAAAGGVLPLLRTVWVTLRDPHIAVPALFIFLWQSCPSPTSALFYFQYYTLHFSAAFQELVYLAGSFAGVLGVLLYQTLLVRAPLKLMLLGCALAGTALSATQLLLVTRANVRLGISDKLFVLGDYAMLAAIAEVMMTPLLALSARVCPPGVEATLYACLYSLLNLSGALSGALGALLTRLCNVPTDPGDDAGGDGGGNAALTLLVALCNACLLLPLPLLAWIPEVAPGAPPPAGLAGVPLRCDVWQEAVAADELCGGADGAGGCGDDEEMAGSSGCGGGDSEGPLMVLEAMQEGNSVAAAAAKAAAAPEGPESASAVGATEGSRSRRFATPFAAAAQAAGAAAAAQACSGSQLPAPVTTAAQLHGQGTDRSVTGSPRRRPPLALAASGGLLSSPSPHAGRTSELQPLSRHGSAAAAAAGAELSPAPSIAAAARASSLGMCASSAVLGLSPARCASPAAGGAAYSMTSRGSAGAHVTSTSSSGFAAGSSSPAPPPPPPPPQWAGRPTGQAALTFVGALAGAQVGVGPLVRMARSRSVALLAAADAAAAAAAGTAVAAAGAGEVSSSGRAAEEAAGEAAES